jgi:hypothetical protein
MPRLYKEDQLPLLESPETAVRRSGGWCEVAARLGDSKSRVQVESQSVEREGLQADSQLRVAEAEAGDSSGTQRKGNVHHWKLLPSSAVKTMTENVFV